MKWFKEHTKLVILLAVLLIQVVIVVVSYVHVGDVSWFGRKLTDGVTTLQEPLADAGNGVANSIWGIFRFRSIMTENEELKKQVEDLNHQVIREKLSALELQELQDLSASLNYVDTIKKYSHVTGSVIALDGSNWFNVFTINVGTKQGVQVDSVVVGGDGLIGRVLEVGDHWAKVISVIDENSNVSFLVARDLQLLGILSGDGNGGLSGYMLDPEASVSEGDLLITSGMGLYPQGIPVGKVSSVAVDQNSLLKTLTIEPVAYFKNIQKVTVIIPNGTVEGTE